MKSYDVRSLLIGPLVCGVGLLLVNGAAAGEPMLRGYADYRAYRAELQSIAGSEFATLESLGRTIGRRDVFLLKIGAGKVDRRPAVLIVGNVHPPHLLGSELAVRLGRQLVEQAQTDRRVRKMLNRVTFYVIPRPAPDASEAFFRRPYVERTANERPTDDDRDGELDEDGPEDLNGDHLITIIRVEDPKGKHRPHPDDPRVLIEADPKKDEQGRYLLYVEGSDNDEDDRQSEDSAGGVAFNRNFTFRYPYFERGSGPHQVCEVETRAVADFAFSHPNIAAVLTFSLEDNLMHAWKPDEASESNAIKTALLSADAGYFDHVAEQYREIHGGTDAPESPQGQGSFSEWAYFHYGRWSFACRGWWVPKTETEKEEEKEEPEEDKRGADDRNALQWFDQQQIDAFVAWQEIAHADFPDRRVEVGGFKPFLRLNPPADQLDSLAEKHGQFLCRLVELLPQLVIQEVKTESLGSGVWRVTAAVANRGFLPTVSEMGRITQQPLPLQIQLELPKGVSLVTGHARVQLPPLAGSGGREERSWLVLAPQDKAVSVRLRAWSPSVGTKVKKIQLGGKP